jgi:hypothetical protein
MRTRSHRSSTSSSGRPYSSEPGLDAPDLGFDQEAAGVNPVRCDPWGLDSFNISMTEFSFARHATVT